MSKSPCDVKLMW